MVPTAKSVQRVQIFTQHPTLALEKHIKTAGLALVQKNPQVIICYGGDGTFLLAERKFPGIPKLLVRKSSTCKKCHGKPTREAIQALAKGAFAIAKIRTLTATVVSGRRKVTLPYAVNNIIIRNSDIAHALRFTVAVDGRGIGKEHIGDGIVVATPFGSTAYYQSITRQTFDHGIGIAFNNTVTPMPALLCSEESVVEVRLLRETASVCADTSLEIINARPGDRIRISVSDHEARIITF